MLDTALLGDLDLIALERLLLTVMGILVQFKLLLVVGAQVADKRVEIVQLALVLAEPQLLFVELHRRVDLRDLLQEV